MKKQSTSHTTAPEVLTPERLRAILEDPDVKERVKDSITRRVDELYEAAHCDSLPKGPALTALELEEAIDITRWREGKGKDTAEAKAAYTRLLAAVERHEPKEYKVAYRCIEIVEEWRGRKGGRKWPDGAIHFEQHIDSVMEAGEGALLSVDSEYFVPFFVKAARDCRPIFWRNLLSLIKRVDEGADLNLLHDEAKRQRAERQGAQKTKERTAREPKDKTSDE